MDDIKMIETVERYIRGEMKPDERVHFEQLRKTNPEIDQLVVEHTIFLHQVNELADTKAFRGTLNDIHIDLAERGLINSSRLHGKAKVIYLWKRYKRVAAIAATIAGITTLFISAIVWSITPKTPAAEMDKLERKMDIIIAKTNQQDREINNVKKQIDAPVTPPIVYKTGGTGFMIDAKGYLVTNAHVIDKARNIAVQNAKGVDYVARIVYTDAARDIAILKIDDEDFKPLSSIPYGISRASVDLAAPIFTLGYPRNEIVYGQGYISAQTGFMGDTLSCQIDIAANRGNSGSPIFNKNGEVIGILNGRQTDAEGFAFAIRSKYLYNAVNKDTALQKIKLPSTTNVRGLDREAQVKRIEDFVYMVKVN